MEGRRKISWCRGRYLPQAKAEALSWPPPPPDCSEEGGGRRKKTLVATALPALLRGDFKASSTAETYHRLHKNQNT